MTVRIDAANKWNHTGFMLEAGASYSFQAVGQWIDLNIRYGPDGGGSGSSLFLRIFERFRRRPKDNWFALIGGIGSDESTAFLIGANNPRFTAPRSGELTCYANDVGWAYFNNKGFVTLTAERLG